MTMAFWQIEIIADVGISMNTVTDSVKLLRVVNADFRSRGASTTTSIREAALDDRARVQAVSCLRWRLRKSSIPSKVCQARQACGSSSSPHQSAVARGRETSTASLSCDTLHKSLSNNPPRPPFSLACMFQPTRFVPELDPFLTNLS